MASSTFSSSTYTSSNLSSPNSSLQLSSQPRISFNTTNFSKSSFPQTLRKNISKSTLIKASLSDTVYVNTDSYYDLLGVSESDSVKEIKKAYKQLARKYHPDVSPAGKKDEYTKMFIQVQEAYETLSDPKTRACYDRDMASGLGLHANFSAKSRRYEPGLEDMEDWEQRWQSQLSDLIRKSNSKVNFENSTWGDRMRSRKSYSN